MEENDIIKALEEDLGVFKVDEKTGEVDVSGIGEKLAGTLEGDMGMENVGALLKSIAGNKKNLGSGNTLEDLIEWLKSDGTVPSDPLINMMSNYTMKSEMLMFFGVFNNVKRLSKLTAFIDAADNIVYDPDKLITMDADESLVLLSSASKEVSGIYDAVRKSLATVKLKKEEDIDKLKLLLGSIPTDKLKEIIKSLNN